MGHQPKITNLFGPGLETSRRPVAIDAAQGRLAQRGDLFQDRLGEFGGDIVGVDKDGVKRSVAVWHCAFWHDQRMRASA